MPLNPFSIVLKVAEADVNARQHVPYDKYLSYFQEARIAYLAKFGYDFDGPTRIGLIATEARCTYRKELRIGDVIAVSCSVRDIQAKSVVMEFIIRLEDQRCAEGSATFLCFDYESRKVTPFSAALVEKIRSFEGLA